MRFIALRDFYRTPAIAHYIEASALKTSPGAGRFVHDNQIHRGFIFEIGKADTAAEMSKPELELAAILNYSNCIGLPDQEVTFCGKKMTIKEKIALDISADEKKAKADREKSERANSTQAAAALTEMVKDHLAEK